MRGLREVFNTGVGGGRGTRGGHGRSWVREGGGHLSTRVKYAPQTEKPVSIKQAFVHTTGGQGERERGGPRTRHQPLG